MRPSTSKSREQELDDDAGGGQQAAADEVDTVIAEMEKD